MLKPWHDALNWICIVQRSAGWQLRLWQKVKCMPGGCVSSVLKSVKIAVLNVRNTRWTIARNVQKLVLPVLMNAVRWQRLKLNALVLKEKGEPCTLPFHLTLFSL